MASARNPSRAPSLIPVEEALGEGAKKMCLLCAAGLDGQRLARRAHVLRLLALVEHPDALPADAALRLAREVLALTRPERTGRRCDPVAPHGPALKEAR
jgi:hypothetical protein